MFIVLKCSQSYLLRSLIEIDIIVLFSYKLYIFFMLKYRISLNTILYKKRAVQKLLQYTKYRNIFLKSNI